MGLYLSKMAEFVDEEHNFTDDEAVPASETESKHKTGEPNDAHRSSSNDANEDVLPGSNSDEVVPSDETESKHQTSETNDAHRKSSNEVNVVSEAPASPKSDVNEFSIKTSRDDFILRVEDKPLYVNRTLLCFFSSVFNDMLNGEFKEKYTDELALTGKKCVDDLEFLQCMYPNIMKPVTIENVKVVLPLAHEYQVPMLKIACEPCLMRHLSRKEVPNDLYEILEKACFYQLNEVKEKCIDIVSERTHEEYEEAESKFTFSDDAGNKIRKKIFHNLKVKYKDVFGHMQTSRALYRFLGAAAKQKVLLNRYLDGKLVGDYAQLVVKLDFDSSAKMCVDGVPVNIRLYMYYNQYGSRSSDAVFSCNCSIVFMCSCNTKSCER